MQMAPTAKVNGSRPLKWTQVESEGLQNEHQCRKMLIAIAANLSLWSRSDADAVQSGLDRQHKYNVAYVKVNLV